MELRVLKELKSALERLPGPLPNFNLVHAILMLITLENGPVGRKKLSDYVGLGEGSVGSLIKRLREMDYLEVGKEGCFLTKKGAKRLRELREVIEGPIELEFKELVKGKAYALLLKGISVTGSQVIELRDEAVRMGGRGAIILIQEGGALLFPENRVPLRKYHPKDEIAIMKSLKPLNGDLVVIGLGDSLHQSKLAALAVSMRVLD